ncbi:MAG: hypothetical protein Q8Q15_04450 [bacterium]|nr:hypothetical protein [bacterium]
MARTPEEDVSNQILDSVFKDPEAAKGLDEFLIKAASDGVTVLESDSVRGYEKLEDRDIDGSRKIIESYSGGKEERYFAFDPHGSLKRADVFLESESSLSNVQFCASVSLYRSLGILAREQIHGNCCLACNYNGRGILKDLWEGIFSIPQKSLVNRFLEINNLSLEETASLTKEERSRLYEQMKLFFKLQESPSLGFKWFSLKRCRVFEYVGGCLVGSLGEIPLGKEFIFNGLIYKIERAQELISLEVTTPEGEMTKSIAVSERIDIEKIMRIMFETGEDWRNLLAYIPVKLEIPIERNQDA